MRYWGTEDNITRSGKTAGKSRRPSKRSTAEGRKRGSRSAAGGRGADRQTIASGGSVKNYPFLRQFYRHQAQLGNRLQKILFALVVAALVYVFVLGDSGAIRITQLRMERSRLDNNIAELEQNIEYLKITIERLEDDYAYIEKIGRERFHYIRPGDRVYQFIPIDNHDF